LLCGIEYVRRTEALERFVAKGLDAKGREIIGRTHADIMARAAAFLLLNDSRASFGIEGEKPSRKGRNDGQRPSARQEHES
jgi:hypothetical protein